MKKYIFIVAAIVFLYGCESAKLEFAPVPTIDFYVNDVETNIDPNATQQTARQAENAETPAG
ncbi:hypothetical protein [Photobacterium sp. OFAV2-7]|uniref:hypothetical protein n=1 Tax=Photobacterium sp. OFAV2-7 TaxID=2917748 RepID=UPI001EF6C492|nr:hypothetical protein [Photobacterium sp. OFAV2-7]MCG7584348.1 hypothetical protein [Photobacterium sp. OFAV2-7]